MTTNPVKEIQQFGHSIWLDFIRRKMLESGEMKQLIDRDGVRGVTSNPAIFEKAIDGSDDYDNVIRTLARAGKNVNAIYDTLTIEDVGRAADLLRPVYDGTKGRDGFVSLEVSPHLARDTEGTVEEARRLWNLLGRPNVMIKVPATREGLPAIAALIGEGINVNITLLFGLERYREVVDGYLSGLESALAGGKPIDRIASVASFFLSRIDVLVDQRLDEAMKSASNMTGPADSVRGQVAVASAKIAYTIYKELFGGERFRRLEAKGGRTQRLLWASTSTKNPLYSDVKYVEPLIGPDTVNTLPLETLEAYRDHGEPAARLETGADAARDTLNSLAGMGIDLKAVTTQLVEEGIEKFNKPYDRLLSALEEKRKEALAGS